MECLFGETGDSKTNKMDMTTALSNIESRVEVPDFVAHGHPCFLGTKIILKDSDPVAEWNPILILNLRLPLGAAFDYENEDILNGLVALNYLAE